MRKKGDNGNITLFDDNNNMPIDLSISTPIFSAKQHNDPHVAGHSTNKYEESASVNIKSSDPEQTGVNINENGIASQGNEDADRKALAELERRDREVRAHEQAHKAVAGRFAAGGPSFQFKKGPNGKFFAVGGHVNIDMSEESTPEKTIQKMQVVKRAAVAPANPSSKDRAVAAKAAAKESEARRELTQEKPEDVNDAYSTNNDKESTSIRIEQDAGSIKRTDISNFSKLQGGLVDTFM